jgi:hypothetical protein
MVARPASLVAVLLALTLSGSAVAQELRRNADGSEFAVHVDPRARPRMSPEQLIAHADRAERDRSGEVARILRIELLSGADLTRFHPQLAPLQEAKRWIWVMWLDAEFRSDGGPGGRERRGRLGWAVYDDAYAAFVAGGFRVDDESDPPTRW